MPTASSVIKQLLSSLSDKGATATLLRSFLDRSVSYLSVSDRKKSVDAILTVIEVWSNDAGMVAVCLGGILHSSLLCMEAAIPVDSLLNVAKKHEKDVIVVTSAARLFSFHVCSTNKLEGLPLVAEAGAKWIALHPMDADVNYYSVRILLQANTIEEVKAVHGKVGEERIALATLKAAVATRIPQVEVNGEDWDKYILDNLFPRLRSGK